MIPSKVLDKALSIAADKDSPNKLGIVIGGKQIEAAQYVTRAGKETTPS